MDRKIKKYEKILATWLKDYAAQRSHGEVEYQYIGDTENHHFQVIKTGWYGDTFRHAVIFHFQIKQDGKLWLWVNNTDLLVTEELEELSIPKNDIVIGFQPPRYRQYSGYAVA